MHCLVRHSLKASGAISEALQALGKGGFAQSVQSSAQQQGPNERGQIGSMLLHAVEQGGGSPSGILSHLGIGAQNPQAMSHSDLGKLAGYVAENHGGAPANLLGNAAAGSGGGGTERTILHLLGTPFVQQSAMKLAQKFLKTWLGCTGRRVAWFDPAVCDKGGRRNHPPAAFLDLIWPTPTTRKRVLRSFFPTLHYPEGPRS